VNGQFAIAAGAPVRGFVRTAKASTKPDERAVLWLDFFELTAGGSPIKITSQVVNVDNARESVDASGEILGILASESISGQIDKGIARVAEKYAGLAGILEAAKGGIVGSAEGDIVYEPGVELTIKLAKPVQVKPDSSGIPDLKPIAAQAQLVQLVVKQPFQTTAQSPPKPSDITNLMFIGSEEQLRKAFTDAGWSPAAALSDESKFETFRAIAELRGYKEAPVSILYLDGQAPDVVFEKQNNTFAQRHHLRIWRRPETFDGQPVWVCAATHDIGIDFSEKDHTFIHKIDSQIDRERAKVVSDLLVTGLVKSLALVDRPEVPRESMNATGDKLETDAQMAVVIF
ncbi:MAG: LssY C-terminal domain-containing protein, partial [Acidobacteria bacterium]|nr:LssY C-terminal domain-containing protein [Acidobacteriota bacterium]